MLSEAGPVPAILSIMDEIRVQNHHPSFEKGKRNYIQEMCNIDNNF